MIRARQADALTVIGALPQGRYAPEGGEEVLARMSGARILRIGGLAEEAYIEGGGLAVDFQLKGGEVERVVFGFTEDEMWVVHHGPIPA